MSNRVGYFCPKCKNRLRITHVYQAGVAGKTSNGVCDSCNKRYVLIHAVIGEAAPREGASAIARKMEVSHEKGTGVRISFGAE